MFSHFPLFGALLNAKLPIYKHNKKQIPLQNYESHCQFCGNKVRKFTSEFSQIHLVRN